MVQSFVRIGGMVPTVGGSENLPLRESSRQHFAMTTLCEVCANFKDGRDRSHLSVVEVPYDARPVLLCTGHAKIAANSGAKSFEQLRELYGVGRRSYVQRRRPAVLQPGGTARGKGRRASDG